MVAAGNHGVNPPMALKLEPGARLVVATHNPGKARELAEILDNRFELMTAGELGLPEPEETETTFCGNALLKARAAADRSGLVAIADDSGICVPALGGAPGVHSARYAAAAGGAPLPRELQDAANNRRLIEATATLPQPVACFYCCVIVLLRHADDPRPLIAEGTWPGVLVSQARGANGFGYDPHFLPDGESVTAAEMSPEHKNRVSHRGQALAALLALLDGRSLP